MVGPGSPCLVPRPTEDAREEGGAETSGDNHKLHCGRGKEGVEPRSRCDP